MLSKGKNNNAKKWQKYTFRQSNYNDKYEPILNKNIEKNQHLIDYTNKSYIINVSAMEGKLNTHTHTKIFFCFLFLKKKIKEKTCKVLC